MSFSVAIITLNFLSLQGYSTEFWKYYYSRQLLSPKAFPIYYLLLCYDLFSLPRFVQFAAISSFADWNKAFLILSAPKSLSVYNFHASPTSVILTRLGPTSLPPPFPAPSSPDIHGYRWLSVYCSIPLCKLPYRYSECRISGKATKLDIDFHFDCNVNYELYIEYNAPYSFWFHTSCYENPIHALLYPLQNGCYHPDHLLSFLSILQYSSTDAIRQA